MLTFSQSFFTSSQDPELGHGVQCTLHYTPCTIAPPKDLKLKQLLQKKP